jgi:hypothetical protein
MAEAGAISLDRTALRLMSTKADPTPDAATARLGAETARHPDHGKSRSANQTAQIEGQHLSRPHVPARVICLFMLPTPSAASGAQARI